MNALEIIEEIKRLPQEEQTKVLDFARQMTQSGRLTPEQLGKLAQSMADTQDPAEADRLREQIIRGFYGNAPHA